MTKSVMPYYYWDMYSRRLKEAAIYQLIDFEKAPFRLYLGVCGFWDVHTLDAAVLEKFVDNNKKL